MHHRTIAQCLLLLLVDSVYSTAADTQDKRGVRHPSKEALQACASLTASAACSFEGHHGLVSGACVARHNKPLECSQCALPAAIAACTSQDLGSSCTYTAPTDSATVQGTCHDQSEDGLAAGCFVETDQPPTTQSPTPTSPTVPVAVTSTVEFSVALTAKQQSIAASVYKEQLEIWCSNAGLPVVFDTSISTTSRRASASYTLEGSAHAQEALFSTVSTAGLEGSISNGLSTALPQISNTVKELRKGVSPDVSPSESPSTSSQGASLKLPLIIGSGVVVLLLLLGCCGYCCWKKSQQQQPVLPVTAPAVTILQASKPPVANEVVMTKDATHDMAKHEPESADVYTTEEVCASPPSYATSAWQSAMPAIFEVPSAPPPSVRTVAAVPEIDDGSAFQRGRAQAHSRFRVMDPASVSVAASVPHNSSSHMDQINLQL